MSYPLRVLKYIIVLGERRNLMVENLKIDAFSTCNAWRRTAPQAYFTTSRIDTAPDKWKLSIPYKTLWNPYTVKRVNTCQLGLWLQKLGMIFIIFLLNVRTSTK